MLCPEVYNFKAPESIFLTHQSDTNENNHLDTINYFTYNHLVSVVLPDTIDRPEILSKALVDDCDYYKVTDLRLCELISNNFINNFVKSGKLYVLSINSRLDCDNCVSVTPSGLLILQLTKSDFQSLGLEGVVSHFHARTKDRYIVIIDLKLPHFVPGKSNYNRTKKCLEGFKETFTVIVTWQTPSTEICPSSVAKYFSDLGYKTYLCEIKSNEHTLRSVKLPELCSDTDYHDITEWLGMVSLASDFNIGGCDKYLSSYETPEPNKIVRQVNVLQWKGLFTANQIVKLAEKLKQFQQDSTSEWISMYVQGFSDSPVAWGNNEHHFYTNGDNSYVVIFNKEKVIVSTQKCGKKRYNNKSRSNK